MKTTKVSKNIMRESLQSKATKNLSFPQHPSHHTIQTVELVIASSQLSALMSMKRSVWEDA